MKRILLAILLALALCTDAGATTMDFRTCVTEGSQCLDGIDGDTIAAGYGAFVIRDAGSTTPEIYFYRVYESGASESLPDIVTPNTNPGTKRWHLIKVYKEIDISSLVGVSAGDILYGSAADVVSGLAKGSNNSILGINDSGTIGWYSSVSIDDSAPQFYDSADSTKKLQFELGSITTGNTRTITVPDASITLPSNPMGGTLGATTNVVPKSSGTGTSTLQASGITEDGTKVDTGALNFVTTGTVSGRMPTAVNSDTTPYNITTAQAKAGTFILNTYATSVTYNLPSAEAGMAVCIRNGQGNSQTLTVDTDGTDYIVMSTGARTSAAGDYYAATADAKNQICLATFNDTDWYVTSEIGTWTEQ